MAFDVTEHDMVPEHRLLEEEEAKALLGRLKVGREQLPKIKRSDPVIQHLEKALDEPIQEGRVIEVRRRSLTAGVFTGYRVVVER